jgi:hypothetical protein
MYRTAPTRTAIIPLIRLSSNGIYNEDNMLYVRQEVRFKDHLKECHADGHMKTI